MSEKRPLCVPLAKKSSAPALMLQLDCSAIYALPINSEMHLWYDGEPERPRRQPSPLFKPEVETNTVLVCHQWLSGTLSSVSGHPPMCADTWTLQAPLPITCWLFFSFTKICFLKFIYKNTLKADTLVLIFCLFNKYIQLMHYSTKMFILLHLWLWKDDYSWSDALFLVWRWLMLIEWSQQIATHISESPKALMLCNLDCFTSALSESKC